MVNFYNDCFKEIIFVFISCKVYLQTTCSCLNCTKSPILSNICEGGVEGGKPNKWQRVSIDIEGGGADIEIYYMFIIIVFLMIQSF